jgi:hypothetical protein
MAFLDDEQQSYYRDRTTWERIQALVIDALQTLSGTRA